MKEHVFFAGIDWQQVYLQKYTPPLIPPRGEVNAADAFDIGSFDEEDTKGIKVGSGCSFCLFQSAVVFCLKTVNRSRSRALQELPSRHIGTMAERSCRDGF